MVFCNRTGAQADGRSFSPFCSETHSLSGGLFRGPLYVRLTVNVADAPRNTMPIVAIHLHKTSLTPGVQTIIKPKSTPTMMQMAKQILFKSCGSPGLSDIVGAMFYAADAGALTASN